MTSTRGEPGPAAAGWEAYWRLTAEAAAHREGGPQEAVLARFWTGVIGQARASGAPARILDLACGNGAVARFTLPGEAGQAGDPPALFGLDGSHAAIVAFRGRFPGARAVVADGRRVPFAGGVFGLVASQFGLEYAGIEAFGEAARLVAPGGALAAVVHMRDGAIFRECAANRAAIERLRACGILPAANEAFRRGYSARRAQGSVTAFRQADARFATAVREVEAILREFGEPVAGGAVRRLHADLAHMYPRMGAYDPAEVASWADAMTRETQDYTARMAAMMEAAIDAAGLEGASRRVEDCGLAVRVRDELRMGAGQGEPAAWVLIADHR